MYFLHQTIEKILMLRGGIAISSKAPLHKCTELEQSYQSSLKTNQLQTHGSK